MPDPAVRAVAADHVTSGNRAGVTAGILDGRSYGVAARDQRDELGARLDGASELCDPGAQQPLGLVLRQVKQEAEPGPAPGELQADQAPGTGVEPEQRYYLAALDEAVCETHHVENLKRAGVDPDRAAFQYEPIAFVDDAGAYAAVEQLCCEYEPGRSRAHDENLAVRIRTGDTGWRGADCCSGMPPRLCGVHVANFALASSAGHLKNYVERLRIFLVLLD